MSISFTTGELEVEGLEVFLHARPLCLDDTALILQGLQLYALPLHQLLQPPLVDSLPLVLHTQNTQNIFRHL